MDTNEIGKWDFQPNKRTNKNNEKLIAQYTVRMTIKHMKRDKNK